MLTSKETLDLISHCATVEEAQAALAPTLASLGMTSRLTEDDFGTVLELLHGASVYGVIGDRAECYAGNGLGIFSWTMSMDGMHAVLV